MAEEKLIECPRCLGTGKIVYTNKMKWYDMGQRIKSLRNELGLSQSELADRCNLTRTSISNLEVGRQKIPLDKLCEIAELLNVKVSSLIEV